MEKPSFVVNGGIRLPIGYRFRPTDEELLVHYLKRKAFGLPLPASVIPDFDVFQADPWTLPGDLKEKRYFFGRRVGNVSDKNCKIGAGSGYWKYIGKDKQIVGSSTGSREAVGVRKTLLFCQGKHAHETKKTRWVMHEYRLIMGTATTNFNNSTHLMSGMELEAEWVVYCIFQKKRRLPKKHGSAAVSNDNNLSNSSKNQTNYGMNRQSCVVFSVENCDTVGAPQPSSSCSSEVTDEIMSSNVLDDEEETSGCNNFSFDFTCIRKY